MYDPQQAGLAALFARLDSKDAKAAQPLLPAVKAEAPEVTAERPSLRDAK